MDTTELNVAEAVIRNVNCHLFFLDNYQRKAFLTWLESHTESNVVEGGKINNHFYTWLESMPKQRALDEGFLIVSEILWFMYRGEFDNNNYPVRQNFHKLLEIGIGNDCPATCNMRQSCMEFYCLRLEEKKES